MVNNYRKNAFNIHSIEWSLIYFTFSSFGFCYFWKLIFVLSDPINMVHCVSFEFVKVSTKINLMQYTKYAPKFPIPLRCGSVYLIGTIFFPFKRHIRFEHSMWEWIQWMITFYQFQERILYTKIIFCHLFLFHSFNIFDWQIIIEMYWRLWDFFRFCFAIEYSMNRIKANCNEMHCQSIG